MIPDADIHRAAFVMMKSHGDDEVLDAAEKALVH